MRATRSSSVSSLVRYTSPFSHQHVICVIYYVISVRARRMVRIFVLPYLGNRSKSEPCSYEIFCLQSHIVSFPKVLQIPPESPCIKFHTELTHNLTRGRKLFFCTVNCENNYVLLTNVMQNFQIYGLIQFLLSSTCFEHFMFIFRKTILYIQPYMLCIAVLCF
jgi:hypothetical protein